MANNEYILVQPNMICGRLTDVINALKINARDDDMRVLLLGKLELIYSTAMKAGSNPSTANWMEAHMALGVLASKALENPNIVTLVQFRAIVFEKFYRVSDIKATAC